MKHSVYYFDDQAHPQTIEANTSEMAAWKFVHQHPRTDTSQITVESQPSTPWRASEMTHYRACDLINAPTPPDEGQPELAIRLAGGPEPRYVVSGSTESLRILAAGLLRGLEQFQSRSDSRFKCIYGAPIIPGDGRRSQYFLEFEADPDIEQYWNRRRSIHGLWTKYGRCLVLLLLFVLACIGIWTLSRWIL